MICESAAKRVFEVTPESETVWEYVGCGLRSYRYSYDYCPQTAALGQPTQVSVTPPETLRIPPIHHSKWKANKQDADDGS